MGIWSLQSKKRREVGSGVGSLLSNSRRLGEVDHVIASGTSPDPCNGNTDELLDEVDIGTRLLGKVELEARLAWNRL